MLTSIRTFTSKMTFKRWLMFWAAVGLLIRVLLMIASNWRMDYDEALTGLLALRIMRGEFYLFIPPEVTGGTGPAYLLAVLFRIFGSTLITFRLLGLVFSVGYILTTGLIGRWAGGERVGILAALFAAFAPPYMIVTGLKTWNTIETILLGNMLLLLAAYVVEKAQTPTQYRRALLLMGLCAGVMFWLSWLGFYYYVPVGLVLLWKGRSALRHGVLLALIGFAIGSLPFWIFQLIEGFPTFTRILNDTPMTMEQRGLVLGDFIGVQFPKITSGLLRWQIDAPNAQVFVAQVYAVGLLAIVPIRRKLSGYSMRFMLVIFVFAVPLIYAFSTHSRNALPDWNPWEIDSTGRYVIMLHTALPVGVALLLDRLSQTRVLFKRLAVGLGIGLVTINMLALVTMDVFRAFDTPYYDRLPHDMTPLIDYLDKQEITHVWTDAGLGQVLMFQTGERILAADYYDVYIAGGLVRFPDVLDAVENAENVAFVVPIYTDQVDPPIQKALDDANIRYTVARVTPLLAVYITENKIDPTEIAGGLGYQY